VPDEKALRKPGFMDGARVTLGDGQEWSIPAGVLTLDDSKQGVGPFLSASEIELLCGSEIGHAVDFVGVLVGLAGRMLGVNYDLTDADLAVLLEYDCDAEWSIAMWRDVFSAIRFGDRERTYFEWLNAVLHANGIDPEGRTLKSAADLANLFVRQGRAIPAGEWVHDAIRKREDKALEGLF